MVCKIILSNYSFFYVPYVESMDVKSIEDSDDFIIHFCNLEKEVISQVFFSNVKTVFVVHYDSIEPYYEDVTEELRLRCKSSRGGASGDIVRPPFGNIIFDSEDYILRFLQIGADIAICVFILLLLFHLFKRFF